ncbi:MAG: hypothetical protein HYT98_03820 [Candidatus Sungbacteria bacterium]|nr:hypothetical protein [Candidatus Sungbacteria bacterium]
MIKNYSQQEVQAQIKKLPPVLREALFDADIAEKIYEIGRNAGLMVDKIGLLAQETGDITLGFSKPSDFIKNLSESLSIDTDKARDIAGRINQAVFLPLREALKTTHQFDVSEETIQKGGSEMRIGREPLTNEELGIKNKELGTGPKPVTTTALPAIPKPPTPPIAVPKPLVPSPTPIKPTTPIGGELKNEIEKVLKAPAPPMGTMPSWITDKNLEPDKNLELRTKNQDKNLDPRTENLEKNNDSLSSKISDLSSAAATPSSPPIDLRSQYRPTMPPSSPKVPPINLRELRTKNLELSNEIVTPPVPRPETPAAPPPPPNIIQEAGVAPKPQSAPIPKPLEKKISASGIDKYKEPID